MKIKPWPFALALALLILCGALEILLQLRSDDPDRDGTSFGDHLKIALTAGVALTLLYSSIIGRSAAPYPPGPAANDLQEPLLPETGLSVTYRSTPAATVRCHVYMCLH